MIRITVQPVPCVALEPGTEPQPPSPTDDIKTRKLEQDSRMPGLRLNLDVQMMPQVGFMKIAFNTVTRKRDCGMGKVARSRRVCPSSPVRSGSAE